MNKILISNTTKIKNLFHFHVVQSITFLAIFIIKNLSTKHSKKLIELPQSKEAFFARNHVNNKKA